jgi:hypothetical protein
MKARDFIGAFVVVLVSLGVARVGAQQKDAQAIVLDGSELTRQLEKRQEKVEALPRAEQELLRVAFEQASKTEEVRAAVEKRDRALREFNDVVRTAILRHDPSLRATLEKVNR